MSADDPAPSPSSVSLLQRAGVEARPTAPPIAERPHRRTGSRLAPAVPCYSITLALVIDMSAVSGILSPRIGPSPRLDSPASTGIRPPIGGRRQVRWPYHRVGQLEAA